MKTIFFVIIGVISAVAITVSAISVMEYQSVYNHNCNSDGGSVVGFLRCTYVREDFAGPKIKGEMADQICKITGGECPPYYIGNIQEDGSVMVGMTFSDGTQEKQFVFLIKNGTLSYEKHLVESKDPTRTPPPEPPFEKKVPATKIELSFGDRLEGLLVPVTFTEVTTDADDLDAVTVWNFELIGYTGDDIHDAWDFLPKGMQIWYEITDSDSVDIINHVAMPENYAIPDSMSIYEMDCGLPNTITAESARPATFLINNSHTVFAKNSKMGLYPDSDDVYSFEFASLLPHYVRFPEDKVEILSSVSEECTPLRQIDGIPEDKGYYTKMSFRFLR